MYLPLPGPNQIRRYCVNILIQVTWSDPDSYVRVVKTQCIVFNQIMQGDEGLVGAGLAERR